jgi:hypothetical protein
VLRPRSRLPPLALALLVVLLLVYPKAPVLLLVTGLVTPR